MSLRDKLRGDRGGAGAGGTGDDRDSGDGEGSRDSEKMYDASALSPLSSSTDVRDFAPRSDGDYHCLERNIYLRFARPVVTESTAAHDEPARGEFSTAGRFAVQRRFSRPVVYTVLDAGDLTAADDAVLVVRRTDTGGGNGPGTASGMGGAADTADTADTAERLEFRFESDKS